MSDSVGDVYLTVSSAMDSSVFTAGSFLLGESRESEEAESAEYLSDFHLSLEVLFIFHIEILHLSL